jgi:hypothetical protein
MCTLKNFCGISAIWLWLRALKRLCDLYLCLQTFFSFPINNFALWSYSDPTVCQVKRLILIQKKIYKTPRIVTLGAALAVSPFTGEDFHR